MASAEERLQVVAQNLQLIEHHIALHWIARQQKPTPKEIESFQQELRTAVKELEDLKKIMKVFK